MGEIEPVDQIGYHTLSESDFDQIASGGGSPPVVERMLASEYSRRLLLLRVLLDLASEKPELLGPLAPASEVWRDLERLGSEPRSAAHLREVLLHPQFGVWISYAIRAVKWRKQAVLWPEVGQIHCATFAAAVRSGHRVNTQLPMRRGGVLLPTLGLARFPGMRTPSVVSASVEDGTASLRFEGHEVVLPVDPAQDAPGWWGLRQLETRSGDRILRLYLDDIDLFRDLADPVAPDRLAQDLLDRWQALLGEAWKILNECVPETAAAIGAGLRSLAPLPDGTDGMTRSASTGDGFGAVLLNRPPDALSMAESLIHEFQHTKLGGLFHLYDLVDDGGAERHYAPWREDARPLAGLFQGAYAYLGITAFWRSRCGSQAAPGDLFEYAYARRQTWTALYALIDSAAMSDLGKRFLRGMDQQFRPWMSDPVPPEAARGSWLAAADHRIGWRIRHLSPDPNRVRMAVEGWLVDTPNPQRQLAGADHPPAASWSQRRLGLIRTRASVPERFLALRAGGGPDADLDLIGGDAPSALEGYRSRLHRNTDDNDAWAGFALACVSAGRHLPWRPLLRRPELVKGVSQALLRLGWRTDPLAIASLCERVSV